MTLLINPANLQQDIKSEELVTALNHLEPVKSRGLDSMAFILQTRSAFKSWLCDFFASCMRQVKILKIGTNALTTAVTKPEKPLGDPKSYRPISLLCVPFKILERLIYARVEPIIDPLQPQEQAAFRHERSTVHQVTLLTQVIDDGFSDEKAGDVFVDLTAAYYTVSQCSPTFLGFRHPAEGKCNLRHPVESP